MSSFSASENSVCRPLARLEFAAQIKKTSRRVWGRNMPALISQSVMETRLRSELRLDRLTKSAAPQTQKVLVFREFAKGELNFYTGKIVTARKELWAIGHARCLTSFKEAEAFARSLKRDFRVHDSFADANKL